MALAKVVSTQVDFSAGEVDPDTKRDEGQTLARIGARQAANWRILNSKKLRNRPGRAARFLESGRVERVTMSSGNVFYIAFGNGTVRIYNSAGAQVFTQAGMPWTLSTVGSVVWHLIGFSIYITFSSTFQPRVLTWDKVSTWTFTTYAEALNGTQKRTPFYRLSPQNITMQPSAVSGSVTLTFSAGMNLVAGHVGTRMRFVERQLLITAVTNSTTATATVEQTLPGSQTITFAIDPATTFSIGDELIGVNSGAKGIVSSINSGAKTVTVQLLASGTNFLTTGENVSGPAGTLGSPSASAIFAPVAVTDWDDEVMNSFRGWPASVSADQDRLIFCNFPALPEGIAWSALGIPTDLYPGANPTDAIFETAPDKTQVFYVVAGPESSEFVFCSNQLRYIPISATNPLKPGSVAFQLLSSDGCAQVEPRVVQEVILYVNAGGNRVMSVVAPGAYYRPYETRDLTELHAHLFNSIKALAVPTGDTTFPERYAYALNGDGTIAVGKYGIEGGLIKGIVGWLPWNGSSEVSWISADDGTTIFTSSYAPNGISAVSVVEELDETQFLDAAISVNAVPTALTPPGGKGPLWWLPSGSVDLIDDGRMMGTYIIDANGFIVPQFKAGENLSSATLVAGQPWTATLEPFAPAVAGGQDVGQRMRKRRTSRFEVYVQKSTGFVMARLFAGPLTPTSPALGTTMNIRRIETWNQDDDPTLPPPLREAAYYWRPLGRAYDPRNAVIKDTPGSIDILEVGIEASV